MDYQTQRVLETREQRVQRRCEWEASAKILQKAHEAGIKTSLQRLAELDLLVQLPLNLPGENTTAGSG